MNNRAGRDRIDMEVVEDMGASVDRLTAATELISVTQAAQIRRLSRLLRAVTIGLVLDLTLTMGGGWLFHEVTTNGNRITATQDQLRDRQVKTKAGTCSIYELFLASYNPGSASARQDPAQYERSFARLEAGAKVIGCANSTRGK